jgi:hypothetical protein
MVARKPPRDVFRKGTAAPPVHGAELVPGVRTALDIDFDEELLGSEKVASVQREVCERLGQGGGHRHHFRWVRAVYDKIEAQFIGRLVHRQGRLVDPRTWRGPRCSSFCRSFAPFLAN